MNLKKRTKKPVLGIFSLACCEGCQVELLNLGEKLFKIFQVFRFGYFNWMAEKEWPKYFDVVLCEGTPSKEEEFSKLKELRKRARYFVALGNCADLGGVQEIKNYTEKEKDEKVKYVYGQKAKVKVPNVVPLHKVVKVDYRLPTCPINREEAFSLLLALRQNLDPQILRRPVCYECQHRGYDCLLLQGKPCLGPITLGGCQAICPKSGVFCYGCRGPILSQDREKFLAWLSKKFGEKRVKEILETFGVEDEVFGECKI